MSTVILSISAGWSETNTSRATITLENSEIVAMRDLLERTSRHMDMGDLDELTNQLLGLEI